MKRAVAPLFLFVGLSTGYAQQLSWHPDSLLTKIFRMQSRGDEFYDDGLFPTKRSAKEDNTIFFTSLIALTLQSAYPSFSEGGRKIVDTIIARARRNYHHYQNRNGDITYNFWQTDPDRSFPNSRYYSKRKRFKLPDDLDVSSIIYLTQEKKEGWDSLLKNKMIRHTNLFKKRIHSTFTRYRNFKAYNTWFGKDMNLEFDIGVMSNVLLFASQKNLTFNQYDNQTVAVINEMIENNDHIKHPCIISPSYQNPSVILYHLARLLAATPHSQFEEVRPKIVADLKSRLQNTKDRMEQIILLSSLYRLHSPVEFEMDFKGIERDMGSFVFFRANLLATNRLWLRKVFGRIGFLNFNFQCEAYYWTLILEYFELKNQAFAGH